MPGGKYTKDDFKAYEKDVESRSKLALKDQMKPKQEYPYAHPVFPLRVTAYNSTEGSHVCSGMLFCFGGPWSIVFPVISVTSKYSSKYDLLMDEDEEDDATSHRHFEKKHKEKKHHHHSDEEDGRKSKKHKVHSIYSSFWIYLSLWSRQHVPEPTNLRVYIHIYTF